MSGRDKLMLASGSLIFVAGGPGVMALLTVWGGQVTFLPELTFTYGFSVFACAFGLFFAAWSVYEMLTKGEGGPAVLGPVAPMPCAVIPCIWGSFSISWASPAI